MCGQASRPQPGRGISSEKVISSFVVEAAGVSRAASTIWRPRMMSVQAKSALKSARALRYTSYHYYYPHQHNHYHDYHDHYCLFLLASAILVIIFVLFQFPIIIISIVFIIFIALIISTPDTARKSLGIKKLSHDITIAFHISG